MTIDTGVPSSLARPQTFHRFTYLLGGGQLVALEQKVAIIATMADPTTVDADAGAIYDIFSSQDGDRLFGTGSEAALLLRQAMKCHRMFGRGPRIVAIGLEEPAGAAATYTLTYSGTATESGNHVLSIAGRKYKIGIAVDDDETDVAGAVVAMLTRFAEELPFTAANVAGVVTLTWNHKGVNGNGLVTVSELLPAGVALVVAAGTAGAGDVDIEPALDALAGVDLDGIAIANHDADDIALALEHVTAMWAPGEKRWRWVGVGDTTSLASATALASAANDRAILVFSAEGSPSLPGEIAVAGVVAAFSRDRPNATYNRMRVPVAPPPQDVAYDGLEVEAGIAAGLTILTPVTSGRSVQAGVCQIERMVTTKTTEDSQPFLVVRDLGVPRTGAYYARQLDAAYARKFGPDANPDGVLMDDDADDRLRDMIASIAYDMAERKILRNVEADLEEMRVEEDDEASGRFDVDLPSTVVVGMMQVAYNHRTKIGVR